MSSANSPNRLTARWAVGLVVLLGAYALLQPQLNQHLGWSLPTLTDWQQAQQPAPPAPPLPEIKLPNSTTEVTSAADAAPFPHSRYESAAEHERGGGLRYGLLRQTGPEEFVSPAGLRYTPGSQEGHRLKHIERHLVDDPSRPGKHGVFDGDLPQVLRWLDEAYVSGRRGGPDVSVHTEDSRTVYEMRFPKPIGYIGGREGGRRQHPAALQIRLVLDGERVITAFPF